MKTTLRPGLAAAVLALSGLASGAPAAADDTEVFRFMPPPDLRPNVLLVIDDSMSMGAEVATQPGPAEARSRLDVVKSVVDDLLETLDGVNVGLMSFGPFAGETTGSDGGNVSVAIADVASNRAALRDAVAALTPHASTPLAETLYEARQYFAGGTVTFGASSVAGSRAAGDTGSYDSPVDEPCQQNVVVLLTDGEPTWDNEADAAILALRDAGNASMSTLTGSAMCDAEAWTGAEFAAPPSGRMSHCLDDLAHFLYEGDISGAHDGTQRVRTLTVGFTVDLSVLESAAQRGNGRAPGDSEGVYFVADDAASLTSALADIVGGIRRAPASFTASPIAVDAFNRVESSGDLFFAVFEPSPAFHWPGNLKRYRLRDDGTIVDERNVAAVDPTTGLFVEGTQSYWSATLDGADVTKGGAAHLVPASRRVYSNLTANARLADPANRVSIANTEGVTAAPLGIADAAWRRDDVVDFINGFDPVSRQPRNEMGDPLHSQPVHVVYGPGAHDALVFVGTNDGFLHALDASTGVEQWAFVPREFLDDQVELLDNGAYSGKHYALDGPLRIQKVTDGDGIVEPGDKIYLVAGMRRGGDFYYALDISDRDDPRLLWRRDATQWAGLGESWSPPAPTRVRIGSTEHLALVIGGGYENDQDADESTTDATGNSIYMVDSATGSVLWRGSSDAGATERFDVPGRSMDYSFPSEIKVIDLDGNGLVDRMYAADMGGQVWRFDVTNGAAARDLVAGGVIAQLGTAGDGTPTLAENRRFYYSPDVAVVNTRLASFTHIGIGSGHREHPLGTVNADRFYAIRDKNVAHLTQDQLDALPIVSDGDFTPVTTTSTRIPATAAGWRLDLLPGEKVLAEARTIADEVFFSTFRPGATPAGSCEPPPGINRLYRMSLYDGSPVMNLDGSMPDEPLSMSDLFVESSGSIRSTPQVVFVSRDRDNDGTADEQDADDDGDGIPDSSDADGDNDGVADDADADDDNDGILDVDETAGDQGWVCTDRLCVPLDFTNAPVRTYWRQTSFE